MKIKGKHFLNNQEFFDASWQWLVVENRPQSLDLQFDRCAYRYEDKTCVVGAFIPDELYKEDMDYYSENATSICENYENIGEWFKYVDKDLMISVQDVHDNCVLIHNRIHKLEEIAKKFNLTVPTE